MINNLDFIIIHWYKQSRYESNEKNIMIYAPSQQWVIMWFNYILWKWNLTYIVKILDQKVYLKVYLSAVIVVL